MTRHERKFARTHDDVLEDIGAALDIPPSRLEEAKERYESIGAWLDRDGSSLSGLTPAISPQGSILLGTVIRPLTDREEYDIDLVCLLSAAKSAVTQKQLKEAVGREVALYAKAHNMANPPEEGRRCWTLVYADGTQFHMDILPAVPDPQGYQFMLRAHGYERLAADPSLTGEAIAITDNTHPHYARYSDDWPQSNPQGYAAWFRGRMSVQLSARKRAYAERERITASVDEIPDHKVKTPLQRAVQLLKRHRDCMFADDPDHKPISIIITTLAAHAYNEEPTITGALQSILTGMDQFIEERNGQAWIANPVNPAENFADKWADEPQKQENFNKWLAQARHDFATYLRAHSFDSLPGDLKQHLGAGLVERTLAAVLPAAAAGLAAPAVARDADSDHDARRAEAAVKDIQREGATSKPWAKQ